MTGNTNDLETKRRLLESLGRNFGPVVIDALHDKAVIEIMLNADGRIWIEKFGVGMYDSGYVMPRGASEAVLNTIASMLDEVITRERPILEGELPLDGSRFEGLVYPCVTAPVFAIRKPSGTVFTLNKYRSDGVLTNKSDPTNSRGRRSDDFIAWSKDRDHYDIIYEAIVRKKNIVVIGGTGSGKTAFVNAVLDVMSKAIKELRLIVIEDTKEIRCTVENSVVMRTAPKIGMMDLLRATLRLRPDRIVVGEIRGAEILALLNAWNTGHPGGITTIHADDAEDGLSRMEQMMQQAGVPPDPALIARAANVLIWIDKDSSNLAGRKVRDVAIVKGFDPIEHKYQIVHV